MRNNKNTSRKKIFAFLFLLLAAAFIPSLANAAPSGNLSVSMGEGGSFASNLLQMVIIITVLSLAPGILVMVTSFTRIIVVLSLLRSALGLQQTPPNVVIISLAMFLTAFIMQPVFTEAYDNAVKPLIDEKITEAEAYTKGVAPFKQFMLKHTRPKDLQLFIDLSKNTGKIAKPDDTPLNVLIPSFMISELKRAFEIGFLVFVPFLVIDLLISSILMAMGMMMLPPVVVSLPFKIIFFVLIDGWYMIAGSLVNSYGG